MARRPRQKSRNTLITDYNAKHSAFTKRRDGIFKKASELCTLCAVEMAIIIFSPSGKPYSFGHPSVDSVVKRLNADSYAATPAMIIGQNSSAARERARREAETMAALNRQYSDLKEQLNKEIQRGKELDNKMKDLPDMEKMNNRDEMMKMTELLEALRVQVRDYKEELSAANLTLGGVYNNSAGGGEASSSSAAKAADHLQAGEDNHLQAGEDNVSANYTNIMSDGDLDLNVDLLFPSDDA